VSHWPFFTHGHALSRVDGANSTDLSTTQWPIVGYATASNLSGDSKKTWWLHDPSRGCGNSHSQTDSQTSQKTTTRISTSTVATSEPSGPWQSSACSRWWIIGTLLGEQVDSIVKVVWVLWRWSGPGLDNILGGREGFGDWGRGDTNPPARPECRARGIFFFAVSCFCS
jgi:hypothetical protein